MKKQQMDLKDNMFYGWTLDKEQEHFRNSIWNKNKKIIFCNSKAGTGKTQIAVASARILMSQGDYDGIVYIVAPTQESKTGYLPGDIEQKTHPYFEPLEHALIEINENPDQVINQRTTMDSKKKGSGFVDALTHIYMRGINFKNKIIIIDEAQNFYFDEIKKVLTRIHDSCKTIIIGHSGQIDLYHNANRSGFAPYLQWFKSKSYCEVCNLTKNYRGEISTHADNCILPTNT